MHSAILTLIYFTAAVSAHFQMQYPVPRGPFVEDNEPNFCDNYVNAVDNRTVFPLSGGFISLNSEHPKWTLGVLVSTVQNPNNFDNFTSDGKSQFAVPFVGETGEGAFCLPVDLQNSNVTGGLKDGQNITLEFVFNGGDGMLYQCADLTLSANATVPSNVTCQNATGTGTSSGASGSATSKSAAVGDAARVSGLTAGLMSLLGIALAM